MSIGGREVHWFEKDSEAVDWLRQLIGQQQSSVDKAMLDLWPMYRGDPGEMPGRRPAPRRSACAGRFRSWKAWEIPRALKIN